MTVQRDFDVLRYGLSSGVAFGDSRGVFKRFIFSGVKRAMKSKSQKMLVCRLFVENEDVQFLYKILLFC